MQDKLNKSLAKAIFVSGIPISTILHHPLWVTFFKQIRPAYKLPHRETVSHTLLNAEYQEIKNENMELLEEAVNLNLQVDGWSNIRNESILNFVVTKPEPIFVDFVDSKSNRHTSEYLAGEIEKVLDKHDVFKFLVLIGDNAANIQKAFAILKEKYPHLIILGCFAHSLHLLCCDILKCDSVKNFMANVIEIAKKIRNVQVLSSLFNQINKEKGTSSTIKLPGATRWGSNLKCLESFLKNKATLQQLVVKEESQELISSRMKGMLLDDNIFWVKMQKLHDLLVPIIKWIEKLQTNTPVAHIVFGAIDEIEKSLIQLLPTSPVQKNEEKSIMDSFIKRKSNILQPIHLAAALLDPAHQGFNLSEADQINAMEAIYNISDNMKLDTAKIMSEVSNYKAKQGLWAKPFVWKCATNCSPVSWWLGMSGTTLLSKVAVKILQIPVTSAATERTFSTFSFIHNKKRNRLTTQKAGMMTYISYNWNLLNRPSKDNNGNNRVDPDYQLNAEQATTSRSSDVVELDSSSNGDSDRDSVDGEDEEISSDFLGFSSEDEEEDSEED